MVFQQNIMWELTNRPLLRYDAVISRVEILWKLEFTILSEHDDDVSGRAKISRLF